MKKLSFMLLILSFILISLVACNQEKEDELTKSDETSTEALVEDSVTEPKEDSQQPEVPLSTVSPAQILKDLYPESKPLKSTSRCKEVILRGIARETVINAFTDKDFSQVDITTIDGAKFETIVLQRNDILVTLYCDDAKGEIRAMYENVSNLDMLSPNAETGKGPITIAQVGTERSSEKDNPLTGMCYVIRLSNGKAIIIDGGFETKKCADNIFSTLKKMDILQDNGKYVIEAWIITHAHKDHYGAYSAFSDDYSSQATVKNVMSAYPGSSTIVEDGGLSFGLKKFKTATEINPHAGIKYYFGNATISVFYTPDMIYDENKQVNYFNDTSIIFRLEAEEAGVLFFGDAGNVAAAELLESYELPAFKSNIFQMTHHGLYSSVGSSHDWDNLVKVYDAIDADYVLLPMQSRYEAEQRNGRYTVMITWAYVNHQIAYVMNESDAHGLEYVDQDYYNAFIDAVANGSNTKETLYGYDGINKIVSDNGLITYLAGNEFSPMVTIFELGANKVTLKLNDEFHKWADSN